MNLVARYFLFAGGALLALLFAFDAFAPKASADNDASARPQPPSTSPPCASSRTRNGPSASCSTRRSRPLYRLPAAPAPQVALAGPEPTPEISWRKPASARPSPSSCRSAQKQAETPAPRKRKVAAKNRAGQPMRFAQQQMRVAQQSQFGFFGGPTGWTW